MRQETDRERETDRQRDRDRDKQTDRNSNVRRLAECKGDEMSSLMNELLVTWASDSLSSSVAPSTSHTLTHSFTYLLISLHSTSSARRRAHSIAAISTGDWQLLSRSRVTQLQLDALRHSVTFCLSGPFVSS